MPITIVILIGLFAVQSRGTARIGAIFGPVMLLWFVTLGVLGACSSSRIPAVLAAVNPAYGVRFFAENGWQGSSCSAPCSSSSPAARRCTPTWGTSASSRFGSRGSASCCRRCCSTTSARARSCCAIRRPPSIRSFIWRPSWATIPLVVLTTLATVIASQAVISGAFSLTRQAVQLGYLPRMDIEHTSQSQIGQIYIPASTGCSWRRASGSWWASGLEQPGCGVRRGGHDGHGVHDDSLRRRRAVRAGTGACRRSSRLAAVFLVVDLGFWGASLLKIPSGGWFPLVIAAACSRS